MTSYFPDLNTWLALSVFDHPHHVDALAWRAQLPQESMFLFSRYTQLGFLHLLTNPAVMGEQVLVLKEAWRAFDRWVADPSVLLMQEPEGVSRAFRDATTVQGNRSASKWIGDAYLLAFAQQAGATLATFDRALLQEARKYRCAAVMPTRR